jgi:hypothetical protein
VLLLTSAFRSLSIFMLIFQFSISMYDVHPTSTMNQSNHTCSGPVGLCFSHASQLGSMQQPQPRKNVLSKRRQTVGLPPPAPRPAQPPQISHAAHMEDILSNIPNMETRNRLRTVYTARLGSANTPASRDSVISALMTEAVRHRQ